LTEIYLIRHAEAEGNIYRRAHGHFNGRITRRGAAQAEILSRRLSSVKFDAVYSSDLSRARSTAMPVCAAQGLELVLTDQLREVDIGAWEDVAWGNIMHEYPDTSELFNSDPARWSIDGSEKYEDVQTRMRDAIISIAKSHEGGTIAVFSHGFAIRAFLCAVLAIPSEEIESVRYCDNTAINLLKYDNDAITVEYHGDNSHLNESSSSFAKQTWWRGAGKRLAEDLRYLPTDDTRDAAFLDGLPGGGGAGATDAADAADAGKPARFTAFLEEETAGYLSFSSQDELYDKACLIESLWIKPQLRGRGFGLQLIGQAVCECRKRMMALMRVAIDSDDSQSALFLEKSGFTESGRNDKKRMFEMNISY